MKNAVYAVLGVVLLLGLGGGYYYFSIQLSNILSFYILILWSLCFTAGLSIVLIEFVKDKGPYNPLEWLRVRIMLMGVSAFYAPLIALCINALSSSSESKMGTFRNLESQVMAPYGNLKKFYEQDDSDSYSYIVESEGEEIRIRSRARLKNVQKPGEDLLFYKKTGLLGISRYTLRE